MKQLLKYTAAGLLCAAATALPAGAQELRTSYFQQTSNFRHQMNPALLDSTYTSVLLGNINLGLTGNIGLKNFVYKADPSTGYDLMTFMHPDVSASQFLGELHDKNRADIYLNYNLFSTAFRAFGGTNLVELNLRSNTNISLPKELFSFMKEAGANEHYSITDGGMRTQNYMELALGHSRNLLDDRLRVGAKVKLLFGLAYADMAIKNMDISLNDDYWRIQGDIQAKASLMNTTWEYEEGKEDPTTGRPRLNGIDEVGAGLSGFGLAFDLGASYKVMDGLTVSAGITDLGFINWKNVMQASSAGDYTFDGFDNIYMGGDNTGDNKIGDQFEALGDDLEEVFSLYQDGEGSASQALAATLNVGAEYELPYYRPLRFGFLYTSRICGPYSWHEGMLSANVRPLKWIEATIQGNVSSTGWGWGALLSFYTKRFNFYVGADRFMGKLSKQFIPLNNMNANVNLGITFPL